MKKILIAIASVILFSSCMKTKEVYTITAESNDPSLGTVTGGGNYVEGSTAILTAMPNPGCKFDHWEYDYPRSTENPLKITVKENRSIAAVFKSNASVIVKDDFLHSTYDYNYFYCHLDVNSKKLTCAFWMFQDSPYPLIELQYVWSGAITPGTFTDPSTIVFSYVVTGQEVAASNCDSITLRIMSIDLDTKLISFSIDANNSISSIYDWGETTSQHHLTIIATDIPITL